MNDYTRKYPGHECPPPPDHPADQPNPPGDGKYCDELPKTEPPVVEKPKPCDPDPCCKCPTKPGSTPNCLEDLIAKQTPGIIAADKAKAFKADLEALLAKAKTAGQEYTRDKYESLVEEWSKQDVAIAELIRKLVCSVPCWRCIIDCYVCPLLNELHYAEKWLYDDGKLPTSANDLYDLQYWHQQDKKAKERRYNRIKNVLGVWEKPAATIEKVLSDNKKLIDAIGPLIGSQPGKVIYDVFLKLVPLHLAIAPPKGSGTTTRIDEKYTEFCPCDKGTPDDCCGPDVGELSLRERLIGSQPYLIDPNDYFKLICCLVEKRYGPAKEALTKAETDLAAVGDRITRYEAQFKDGWEKTFETNAKAAIPSVIDCCDYDRDDDHHGSPQSR